MLAEVPDPRKKKGLRYPLPAMLSVLVVGMLCGQKGYTYIATWLRRHPTLAKALGFNRRKTPAGSTFHNLLKAFDIVKLEQTLTKWVKTTYQKYQVFESRLTAVVIDGKSVHGTNTEEYRRLHLLAAVSHELGIPLAQCAVGEKTNEIPVASQLLHELLYEMLDSRETKWVLSYQKHDLILDMYSNYDIILIMI